jgi:hypothetical protein
LWNPWQRRKSEKPYKKAVFKYLRSHSRRFDHANDEPPAMFAGTMRRAPLGRLRTGSGK